MSDIEDSYEEETPEASEKESEESGSESSDDELLCEIEEESGKVSKAKRPRTLPILTKYEKSAILEKRVGELSKNFPPYIEVPISNIHATNLYAIAERELYNYKLPYVVVRKLPCGVEEIWHIAPPREGDIWNLALPDRSSYASVV